MKRSCSSDALTSGLDSLLIVCIIAGTMFGGIRSREFIDQLISGFLKTPAGQSVIANAELGSVLAVLVIGLVIAALLLLRAMIVSLISSRVEGVIENIVWEDVPLWSVLGLFFRTGKNLQLTVAGRAYNLWFRVHTLPPSNTLKPGMSVSMKVLPMWLVREMEWESPETEQDGEKTFFQSLVEFLTSLSPDTKESFIRSMGFTREECAKHGDILYEMYCSPAFRELTKDEGTEVVRKLRETLDRTGTLSAGSISKVVSAVRMNRR